MSGFMRWCLLSLLLGAGLFGCSDEPEAISTEPVVEPLEALPPLRTGARALVDGTAIVGSISARMTTPMYEYLEITLPDAVALPNLDRRHVALEASAPGALAVFEPLPETALILIRRTVGATESPSGTLFVSRGHDLLGTSWERVTFSVATGANATNDDTSLDRRWLEAIAAQFESPGAATHPWFAFAAGRVRTLLHGAPSNIASPGAPATPARRTELTRLMETTSGMLSVQEALQHDRGLRLGPVPSELTVDIAELTGPALAAHPFAAMQATLAKPDGATPEPLAAAVPAAFWYLRVDDIRVLLRLLDEADAWVTPVVQALQRNPDDRRLSARYQAQLGLQRSGMAKLLGHAVVGQVALTGSDPYLREGSDVSVIFSVKQQSIFDQELGRHLEGHARATPGLASSSRDYRGVSIAVNATADGRVRQQRAQVENLAIVSNSPRAIERIIDAIQGQAPRLVDEADFKYMLARDPGAHQVLGFLSDRFIAAVIGPQQKLLAARRQLALAELLTPGYAALLHGWLNGQPAATTAALIGGGLLHADELIHADGAAIDFTPGTAAMSAWGSPEALTPLIDLPAVTTISVAEKAAYEMFVSGYQQYWKQFIDPVALRLDLAALNGPTTATIDLRILPLISASDYNEIQDVVGNARITVKALDRGVEAVWAVGADAKLRNELDGMMRSMSGSGDIGLGWLGSWLALGIDDRAALLELYSRLDDQVQLPLPNAKPGFMEDLDMWKRVGRFPIYAAVEVDNPVMLIATLTAIRTMLGQVAPGAIDWREAGSHRELGIVRVGMSKGSSMLPDPAIADAVALHYVLAPNVMVLALDPETLRRVADRHLDGKSPEEGAEGQPQFVIDARSPPGAPLWTAMLWWVQGQVNESQDNARLAAEILLRAEPALQQDPAAFAARALAYFGSVPVTAQGDANFELRPEGAGDKSAGTTKAPVFVALPIPGSPVARLMERLTRIRAEVSFDPEPAPAGPQARSLHTRFEINLGAEVE